MMKAGCHPARYVIATRGSRVVYLPPRIRRPKGLTGMTLVWHEDLTLTHRKEHPLTGKPGTFAALFGIRDEQWTEKFVAALGTRLGYFCKKSNLGLTMVFTDQRVMYDNYHPYESSPLRPRACIKSLPDEVSSWSILVREQDYPRPPMYPIVVIELSGSVDRPEVIAALVALGFHTQF